MSSSASLPSPDDDYAAPLDARLNKAFWDAALKSVGARIRALEAVKADWEELINQGTGQALAVIQANVEPQLAALTAVINQLKAEVAAAEDAIAVIIAGGVNMSAVTGLADALAAKASLSALNGAVSALTLLMDDYVSHAEAQTLTTEQKARALSNLGLEDIHKTLTPFGFTATAGQTTFDLGMSPSPNACIFSLNGAWLTNGVDYAVAGSTLTLSTPAEAGDRVSGVAIGSFEVANAMLPAANLADLGDKSAARGNLGLGSAAILNAGTGANQLPKLDGAGKLPVVDGSQLTGIGRKLISTTNISAAASADLALPSGFSKFEIELLAHTGNNYMLVQVRVAGSGTVLSGATDYKQVAQLRATGVVSYDGSTGSSAFRTNHIEITWKEQLIELDNLSGLIKSQGWAANNEMSAMGRIQTPGPYDLLRLTPNTGTLTCTCKLFGYRDAS